jgi:membrane associated rhomboid family serine protease
MSRASSSSELLGTMPSATLGVMAVCVVLFAAQNVLGWDLQLFTMCPRLVLYTHDYYRVVTAALFHANLMHIGMNMLSTSAIGGMLERKLGTFRLFVSVWWAILLTSGVYLSIAYVASIGFGYDKWMYQHSVGFSGIIFHLSVLESNLQPGPRSVFGFFSVPSSVYPWVLLVVLQMIMPDLSFLGHLAGILTGTLQYYGLLDGLLLGESFLMDLEAKEIFRPVVSLRGFVATQQGGCGGVGGAGANPSLGHPSSMNCSSMCRALRAAWGRIFKVLRDALETLLVCVFGRGYRLNMNIRLWPRSSSFSSERSDRGVLRSFDYRRDHDLLLQEDDGDDSDEEGANGQQGWINGATVATMEQEPLVSRMV